MLSQTLVNVSMGREPADLVIKNGQWVCVQSGEILAHTDIAIAAGHIAYVGEDASHAIGQHTRVIDAGGSFLVPGLLDAHMHVESGMVTVTEFVRAVAIRGTTGMFVDPHEIANVFGLKGVKLMVDEAAVQPIHVWVQMPSCVPSAPGMETPGASITPEDVAEAMTWPGIIGLGEMMNFPGVINTDPKLHAEMTATRKAGKVISGHYPVPDLGLPFHGYVAGGAEDDHEGTRPEDAIARVRQGMKPMLRYGSAWFDVASQLSAITEKHLDARHFLLCTDDSHAETLASEGHMDRVLRHAISHGLAPLSAIQMATLNTAEHFGLSREIGQIAPGRWADVLIVDDLTDFHPRVVIARGVEIARDQHLLVDLPPYIYPAWATESVRLGRELSSDDFRIPAPAGERHALCHVIGVIENHAPTQHLKLEVPILNGELHVSTSTHHHNEVDLAKLALVERHNATGRVTLGLVSGFGLRGPCAIASTVVHDSHQMIVAGTDDACMALAANWLAENNGGQVVVKDGKIIGEVRLPIAGLMSKEPVGIVAHEAASVLAGFKACGCHLNNPNMQLSLLALVVIPELRLSDKGLVDVTKFEFISLIEE